MHASLSNKLPFWHFEKSQAGSHSHMMVYSDGSLGVGFKLEGIDISCATNNFKNEFSVHLENVLNGIPENIRLQVFYKLSPNVQGKIDEHESISKGACENCQQIKDYRISFLRESANQGAYFKPEIYLFVRSTPHRFSKQKLWQNQKKYKQITQKQFKDHEGKFLRTLRQVESAFEGLGLAPKRLQKEEWFHLIFECLNLSRSTKIGFPTLKESSSIFGTPITEQLNLSDLKVHPDYLEIGDYFFKVITLKTLPEGQTFATMVDGFTKLPFHFWLTQNILIHDQKKEMEKLQLQRRLANSLAKGAKNVSDLESESKLAHLEEIISELLEGSEKILSSDFNVTVWGKSIEELNDKSDYILKAIKGMNQSEGIVESLPCLDVFLGAIPSTCQGLRYKKMKTSNLASFLPLYGYWEGNKEPVCLLQNRDGALLSLHPFAPELLNWNGLIFGGSGSGKSFVVSSLMLMFYGYQSKGGHHPKIVWLDNGASSQRLVEVLGGEVIDLQLDSQLCLNVFDLASAADRTSETEPSPSKVKLILAVLETIFKEDDKASLPKRHKALLEEAIFKVYAEVAKDKRRMPQLNDLKKVLKEHEEPKMKKYAQSLFSWVGNTPYGRMLDGQTNVSLSKDLITIEMKGLDSYPDLQNVFLLLFTDFIKAEASQNMSQPYLLVIDEAWKLFQTPSGAAFAHEAYRTFRKFLGGIFCISQNYADTLSTQELRKSLFSNTSFLLVLKQQVDNWKDFRKKLNLNKTELELIKGIQVIKGEYSEMFLRQNENKALIRMVVDPLTYWICTSDASDKARIQELEIKNPTLSKLQILMLLADEDMKEAGLQNSP